MTGALSQCALNRATLARQYLLKRAAAAAIDAIEHLAGLQPQAPLASYAGLWTRLRDFAPGELSALTEDRQVVRLHLMRNTLHLVSARDALAGALCYPLHAAEFIAHFRHGSHGADLSTLLAHATRLLEEQPRTRAELGKLLAERWPGAAPSALAYAATHHIALCQVPPRGIWGSNGPAAWAPVENWLGAPLRPVPGRIGPSRRIPIAPLAVVLAQVKTEITRKRNLNPRRSYPRVVKRWRTSHYAHKKPGDHGTRHNRPPAIRLANPVKPP